MVDSKHHDLSLLVVDAREHPKRSAAGAPDSFEFPREPLADLMWILDKCAGDEVDNCDCNGLGQLLGKGTHCGARNDELVRAVLSRHAASGPRPRPAPRRR